MTLKTSLLSVACIIMAIVISLMFWHLFKPQNNNTSTIITKKTNNGIIAENEAVLIALNGCKGKINVPIDAIPKIKIENNLYEIIFYPSKPVEKGKRWGGYYAKVIIDSQKGTIVRVSGPPD